MADVNALSAKIDNLTSRVESLQAVHLSREASGIVASEKDSKK